MPEHYCPYSKQVVEFLSNGEPVDNQREITRVWTCAGCRYFVLYPRLIRIYILAGDGAIDKCSAVLVRE